MSREYCVFGGYYNGGLGARDILVKGDDALAKMIVGKSSSEAKQTEALQSAVLDHTLKTRVLFRLASGVLIVLQLVTCFSACCCPTTRMDLISVGSFLSC